MLPDSSSASPARVDRAPEGTAGATAASVLEQRLRVDILAGRLSPGSKLALQELSTAYQTGMIPLREALNRLSAEGWVRQLDRRGFFVDDISVEDIVDLTQTRSWLYEGALRAAIARGDQAWEDELVLSFFRLGKVPRYDPDRPHTANPAWLVPHRRFHTALIAACGSVRTIRLSERLFDQAERYRYVARLAAPNPAVQDEHRAIMEAALARDADRAVDLLLRHIERTRDTVVDALRRSHPGS